MRSDYHFKRSSSGFTFFMFFSSAIETFRGCNQCREKNGAYISFLLPARIGKREREDVGNFVMTPPEKKIHFFFSSVSDFIDECHPEKKNEEPSKPRLIPINSPSLLHPN